MSINYALIADVIDGHAMDVYQKCEDAVKQFLTEFDPDLDDVRADVMIPVIDEMSEDGLTGRMHLLGWMFCIHHDFECYKCFLMDTDARACVNEVRGRYYMENVYGVLVRHIEDGKTGVYEAMMRLYGRMELEGQVYTYHEVVARRRAHGRERTLAV